jgi:hypothetical protein
MRALEDPSCSSFTRSSALRNLAAPSAGAPLLRGRQETLRDPSRGNGDAPLCQRLLLTI